MGAEVGATTSTFPYTANMRSYLNATGRAGVAKAADEAAAKGFLSADEGAEYDEVIEIVSSSGAQPAEYDRRALRSPPNNAFFLLYRTCLSSSPT